MDKVIVLIKHNCFGLAFLLLLLCLLLPHLSVVLFSDLSRLFLVVVVFVLTQSPTNRVRDYLSVRFPFKPN